MAKKSIPKKQRVCQEEDCGRIIRARGYCTRHYAQYMKHGHTKRTYADPNEFIFDGNICRIKLYNIMGEEVDEAIIDIEDYKKVRHKKWHKGGDGYVASHGKKNEKIIRLHHIVTSYPPPGFETDHINGNRLDCRKSNLRICTRVQNSWNHGVSRSNKSGSTGVCIFKQTNKWRAYLSYYGKQIHLGYFNDKENAIKARNNAAIKYYGEYARLNEVKP